MATLIQNLNLANTFGEWVSITNETVSAYNTIYASDFTKPTGTLYLSGPGTSLSVANGSVFTGLVDISGAGSLLVRHNAEVQNTLYLTNKDGGSIHSLVFSANGVANVNYINITGAGRSANVLNSLYVGNSITISTTTSISANGFLKTLNNIDANNLVITNNVDIGRNATVTQDLTVLGDLNVSGNFVTIGDTVYSQPIFVLSDGNPFANTSTGERGVLRVSRNTANAEFRWNNNDNWWEVRDVNNSSQYNRLLTANDYISINTSFINVNSIVSSNVASLQSQIAANAVSANAMIVQANSAMKTYVDGNFLQVASGGSTQTIASDVTITGNFSVNGTTTYINTQTITTQDSLIRLANNNTSSDTLDIGFIAPYQTGGFTRYTGLFRKAGSGVYYLSQAIANDPTANVVQNFGTNFRATLDANFTGGQISGLSNPLGITDGGTGATSASAALTSLLTAAAGTGTSGQVLATSGAGSYYWATGGTGGGGTQGTTISSARLTYIVGTNATAGETRFTAPTYIIGASQTRVYINGVRQFLSDYSEANTTAIILTSGLVAGDTMVIEVDGYNTYTQLASATSFSPTGDISANTVQNAIAEVDSEKAPKASPTFTGTPVAPTANLAVSAASTQIATIGYVTSLANSNYLFSHSITGNAGSATNATNSVNANFALGAGNANTSNFATSAGTANTAGYITNSAYNGFGVRTVQPTASGVPTGGSSGDIVYQY